MNKFFCSNGHVYNNLKELHAGLLTMSDITFKSHVTDVKNDFADWLVQNGFHDLAKDLRKYHSRALMAYKIGQYIRGMKKDTGTR